MRLYLPGGMLRRPDADVSDVCGATPCSEPDWEPGDVFVWEFDRPPSASEREAIRRRLVTTDAADEQRLYDLIAARAAAATLFERLWLDTELAKYGETTEAN